MKKIASVATALLLSSSLFAQQQGSNGIYVGVGLGLEAMPKHVDNGMGLALKGGVELDQLLKNFGLEAELSTSLIAPEVNDNNIDVLTLGLYTTYTIAIPNSPVSVRPKFGVILPNLSDDLNSRDVALSTGVAGLFNLNEQIDIYAEYVNTSESMNNYMVGVEINF
ncbi:MAG: outer membrane beta-barrel protein [Campylobacterales bacterium]